MCWTLFYNNPAYHQNQNSHLLQSRPHISPCPHFKSVVSRKQRMFIQRRAFHSSPTRVRPPAFNILFRASDPPFLLNRHPWRFTCSRPRCLALNGSQKSFEPALSRKKRPKTGFFCHFPRKMGLPEGKRVDEDLTSL
jgi:hypothetical protein